MWLLLALQLTVGPAGHHVVVAPAESLWVEIRGEGETVVLVPGLAGSAFTYRGLVPRLVAEGYRTVVIEPLGIGRSSRPRAADYALEAQARRVTAVLDSLSAASVVLVAHSVCGSVALRAGLQRPDLVRALVLLDGGPEEEATNPSLRNALRFAPLLRLVGGRAIMRGELARQLALASGDASWVTEPVIAGYADPVVTDLGRSVGVYQAMARAREPERLAPRLPALRPPVLLLWGSAPRKNTGLTRAAVHRFAERLPSLIVEELPGVGHYIHEERPEAVAAAIIRFARAAASPACAWEAGKERRAPCVQW